MIIDNVTILPGFDKNGKREAFNPIILARGTVTSLVGPTGAGKSRLLADLEWLAQGDTPTKRHILLNGNIPSPQNRFSIESKLVAQLSQNMNFVMDASVKDFIVMHAQCRNVGDNSCIERLAANIIEKANELAGEPFSPDSPLTSLSGGQSRALMIADTAFLSSSPIVLIDEIENAGIDRKKALALLISKDKIVLLATHDPLLALMAHRRLVINNGSIIRIIETTFLEKNKILALEQLESFQNTLRQRLRNGEMLEDIV